MTQGKRLWGRRGQELEHQRESVDALKGSLADLKTAGERREAALQGQDALKTQLATALAALAATGRPKPAARPRAPRKPTSQKQ